MTRSILACLVCVSCVMGACLVSERADAWVKDYQPFPEGEATVVLHWFCQRQSCPPNAQMQGWRDMILDALDKWNKAGANFTFRTRRVRVTDDPCNLPGEVAVILTEDGRLCSGDGPMSGGSRTIAGRIEYKPYPHGARVYIKAPDDFLFDIRSLDQEYILTPFLIHEFGHVVGLGHPDEAGQSVGAVMNSVVALHGHSLSADDIAGIRALYGQSDRLVGFLENPGDGSSRSGIGVISGWVCEADEVKIQIWSEQGGWVHTARAAYGTSRADTEAHCGDTDNGFGLLFNWNLRGTGEHIVDVLVDGEHLARAQVTITTLDGEFPTGLSGRYVLGDFPEPGASVVIEWEESLQNFVITEKVEP